MFGFWSWLIIFIISLIAGTSAGIIFFNDDDVSSFVCTVICIFMVGIVPVSYLISSFSVEKKNVQEYVKESNGLKSLTNNNETTKNNSGSFIMGFGFGGGGYSSKEQSKSFYYTIVDYEGKGYKIEKYDCDITYIQEDDLEQPYVEVIYTKWDGVYKKNIIAGIIFKPLTPITHESLERYILHVPKNTIQIEWDVSLENLK